MVDRLSDIIEALEKARQLWAKAESAKSNKLWQTEEDARQALQVAMYDFWKSENIRLLLDAIKREPVKVTDANALVADIVAAWEALPGGYRSAGEIADWLRDYMHPVITRCRAALALPASPPATEAPEVTDAMVLAAEAAFYGRHERGFIQKPLIGAKDMRAALEAAMLASSPHPGENAP